MLRILRKKRSHLIIQPMTCRETFYTIVQLFRNLGIVQWKLTKNHLNKQSNQWKIHHTIRKEMTQRGNTCPKNIFSIILESQLLSNSIYITDLLHQSLTGRLAFQAISPLFVVLFGRSLQLCHLEFDEELKHFLES